VNPVVQLTEGFCTGSLPCCSLLPTTCCIVHAAGYEVVVVSNWAMFLTEWEGLVQFLQQT